MQLHRQREFAGCVVVAAVLHIEDAQRVSRLPGRRLQPGRSLQLRNGGRIVVLQLEGETEIVAELEVLGIGLEAGAKHMDGFIDFVHLQVRRGQILMRGGISRLLFERTLKKRNCILWVSSNQKSQSQARARLPVLRL